MVLEYGILRKGLVKTQSWTTMNYTNDEEELFPSSGHSRVSRLASVLLPVENAQGLEGGSYSFLLSFRAHLFNSVGIFKCTFNSSTYVSYKIFPNYHISYIKILPYKMILKT